ncbi:hypothetical protein OH77DRAFT_1438878 [Trametes cingulata]|nr:hypothetical protein OH77DRAFT_1438878 [Trametes cingulata]
MALHAFILALRVGVRFLSARLPFRALVINLRQDMQRVARDIDALQDESAVADVHRRKGGVILTVNLRSDPSSEAEACKLERWIKESTRMRGRGAALRPHASASEDGSDLADMRGEEDCEDAPEIDGKDNPYHPKQCNADLDYPRASDDAQSSPTTLPSMHISDGGLVLERINISGNALHILTQIDHEGAEWQASTQESDTNSESEDEGV